MRLLDFLPFLSYNYGCVNIQKSVVIISEMGCEYV
nr:MAG TPA: hypothetical protein [Caudoviricetes sp.]